MFHEQHRDPAVAADPADQIAKRMDFLVVEAAGWFIEQQNFWLGGERARQFHAFLGSKRQPGNRGVGYSFEFEIADDFVNAPVDLGLAATDPGKPQGIADDVAVGPGMSAEADIVEDGKIWKQRDVLEGASDADFGDPVRRPVQDAPAFHQDVACARLIEPAQAIEKRGFAGPVRADQAQNLAMTHLERHAVQGDNAAEYDADIANRKQRRILRRRSDLRHRASHRSWTGPERPRQFAGSHPRRLSDPLGHARKFPSCFRLPALFFF